MTADWILPGWAVLVALGTLVVIAVLLGVALARSRARTARALEAARLDAEALRAQVEDIERRLRRPESASAVQTPYTITLLGTEESEPQASSMPSAPSAPVVPGPLFADLVLRESVVQAGSFVAGLRRALAPEMRHRIRFEMKREVKRARKQRRADLREARRDWEARQRQDLAGERAA